MRRNPYDKQAVIADLTQKKLKPEEIGRKHGISTASVYTIRSAAKRAGLINSRGEKSIGERVKDESSVFTPALRERIKDMRENDLTSTEISLKLISEGIDAPLQKVIMVMARGASDAAHSAKLGKKWGIIP